MEYRGRDQPLEFEVRGLKRKYEYKYKLGENQEQRPCPAPPSPMQRKYSYLQQEERPTPQPARRSQQNKENKENKENYASVNFSHSRDQVSAIQQKYLNQTLLLQSQVNQLRQMSEAALTELSQKVQQLNQQLGEKQSLLQRVEQGLGCGTGRLEECLQRVLTQNRRRSQLIDKLQDLFERVGGKRPQSLKQTWRMVKNLMQRFLVPDSQF